MFYHRYNYDAENRLTLAETSMDSVTWEKETRYEYYRHGPLARTITGEQLVQGTDYAYTLQGWLKGVNAAGINKSVNDMGGDGLSGNSNQYTAKDALGFNLNYFSGEYLAINSTVATFPNASTYLPTGEYRPLYNGNISSMAVNIKFPSATAVQVPQLYNYRYDQLNRITAMDAYRGYDTTANSWSAMSVTTDYKERLAYDANGNILKYLRNGISSVSTTMDSLTYNYYSGTNRLKYVKDNVADNVYTAANADIEDINNQTNTSNYAYTQIGNLKTDLKDSILLIKWNVYGKITEIQRIASSARPITNIWFTYDAAGNRISKKVSKSTTTNIVEYTWYVRDASGNVMATYSSSGAASNSPLKSNFTLQLSEQGIYGSSRAGLVNRKVNMKTAFSNPVITIFERGNKNYELSNHLGNVLVTVSDKKIAVDQNADGQIDYYTADVITANDYYPFGSLMPGRKYAASSSKYRYGFNGKENDNDVKGEGNQQDYGMRIYDPRIAKFLSVDPITKEYAELTPYQFASNSPILNIDIDGLEGGPYFVGLPANQQMEAAQSMSKMSGGIIKGFGNSAYTSVKSIVNLTSTSVSYESVQAKMAMVHAVSHPKETVKNVAEGLKSFGKNLNSSDPSKRGYAFGQLFEFGAELLIPFSKGASGTKIAGRTVNDILDVSKGITSRGLLEDYALSTKAYKGFENANIKIGANNPVFDLFDKAGNVVDVTSTSAKTINASQFYKKLDRLADLKNVNMRTLQIYVKDGQYTAEQLSNLSKKLTEHIKDTKNTSFKITPLK